MKKHDCCLIQIACGDQSCLMELTMRRHAEYCARHEIDYRLTIGEQTTQACFIEKWFEAIMGAVEEGYSHVVFLDADCFIVADRDLREGCPKRGIGLTWHDNPNWKDDRLYDHFNIGALYITNGAAVRKRLREWRSQWSRGDYALHPWGHQHLFNKSYSDVAVKISHAWNSTPYYPDPAPFVMAWHGYGDMAQRYDAMREAVEGAALTRTVSVSSPEESIARAQYYESTGQLAEAEAFYRFCLDFDPDNAEIMKRVGCLLNARNEWTEALEFFEKAAELAPDDGELWMILGGTCQYLGDLERALFAAERSMELIPGNPAAHVNRGMALLRAGRWPEGFREMEWQYVCKNRDVRHPTPAWDGKSVQTLYVYHEQGYGDTLMLFRLLDECYRRGLAENIILEVPTSLVSLLTVQVWNGEIVEREADGRFSKPFDAHIGLMSLPRILSLTPEDVQSGRHRPLRANSKKATEWREKLTGSGFSVGICWAGNRTHANDRNRSISAALFDDLVNTPGCSFVSLQKDAGITDEIRESTPEVQFLGDDLADFADTAAVIANLDLVITVDTAVAHLAGAMGKPVWILLSKASDWRWLANREDCVWYEHARLFRQRELGSWGEVMADVQRELEKMRDGN